MFGKIIYVLSISCCILDRGNFANEGIQYALRITVVKTCAVAQPHGDVQNVSINSYDFQQYVSMAVVVHKNFYMDKVKIRLERCLNYACEYFQQWTFARVCAVALMKNQIWSPIIAQIRPQITCPILKKGVYQTTNATLNINRLVQFYPEAARYEWKVNFTIINDKGSSIYCLHFEGHLIPYTKHQKRIKT